MNTFLLSQPTPLLLMTWRHKEPRQQKPRHWYSSRYIIISMPYTNPLLSRIHPMWIRVFDISTMYSLYHHICVYHGYAQRKVWIKVTSPYYKRVVLVCLIRRVPCSAFSWRNYFCFGNNCFKYKPLFKFIRTIVKNWNANQYFVPNVSRYI